MRPVPLTPGRSTCDAAFRHPALPPLSMQPVHACSVCAVCCITASSRMPDHGRPSHRPTTLERAALMEKAASEFMIDQEKLRRHFGAGDGRVKAQRVWARSRKRRDAPAPCVNLNRPCAPAAWCAALRTARALIRAPTSARCSRKRWHIRRQLGLADLAAGGACRGVACEGAVPSAPAAPRQLVAACKRPCKRVGVCGEPSCCSAPSWAPRPWTTASPSPRWASTRERGAQPRLQLPPPLLAATRR